MIWKPPRADYQDGSLAGNRSAKAQPESQPVMPTPPAPVPDPTLADTTTPGDQRETPGTDDSKSAPPPRDELMEGPNPFDVPVPPEAPKASEIKPTPPKNPKQGKPAPKPSEQPKPAVAKAVTDPAFSGYQRKTAIVGSISRTGRSAARCGGLAARPLSGHHQPRRRAGMAAQLRAPPRFHHPRISNRALLRRNQRQGPHRPVRRRHGDRRGPERFHPQLHPRRRHPRRCPPP